MTYANPSPRDRSVLATVRRHKRVVAAVFLLTLVLVTGTAFLQRTTYSAEARLAVDGQSLTAQAVPGFALASQELAANYARYVNNAAEQSDLESEIGAPPGSIEEVSASPIPNSNVVRIEVTATDPDTAVAATARIADSLMSRVNDATTRSDAAAAVLDRYTTISDQVATAEQAAAAAQTAVDTAVGEEAPDATLAGLRQTAASAAAQLSILQVQQEALGDQYRGLVADNSGTASQLSMVEEATSTGNDLVQRLQRFGVLGVAAGAALAVLVAVLDDRRRPRRPSELASGATAEDVHGSGSTDADEAGEADERAARELDDPRPARTS